ncbi:glycoside hydrolase family 17 protein [Bipolaris victoriae FI3]|uniref:glucan endo-1,3-beta-D-glucosidase n=1 Tax=Bipolaris victoriae (strain FI3) TaxID=930091 RepID=W7E187_BIPV3|nr:glycoside hydrolase family 17 protein [Bipolaris victoriae FI3]
MWAKAASLFALAATAVAQSKGFNYGATNADGSCRGYDDFVRFFNEAKSLPGTSGFNTARLYTSIQCGSQTEPISAFRAAIDTDTRILVGLWASAGRAAYERELNALLQAARDLGTPFTDRIIGISVGSEDLYRSSEQGIKNKAGVGATGAEIEGYIGWLRDWVRGTGLAKCPVGHVDTWTAWTLAENRGVARAVDWLGHNSFPYFESDRPNSIDNARDNFFTSVAQTASVADGKEVIITETGWPRIGPVSRDAIASLGNMKRYWKEVGCSLFGVRTTFWYTLKDANAGQTDLSFAITPLQNNTPYFDLTC